MKNTKVMRPTLFNYIVTREEFEKYASELFKLMSEDKFVTRIHETYPLQDVARAHNVGRILSISMGTVCAKERFRTLKVEKLWASCS